MTKVEQELTHIRELVAQVIANREVVETLGEVCRALGLPIEYAPEMSKAQNARRATAAATDEAIVAETNQMLTAYPGTCGGLQHDDQQRLQDAVWWIESDDVQHISGVTRCRIAEALEERRFWGRLSIGEFFRPVHPALGEPGLEVGPDGHLHEGLAAWAMSCLFGGKPEGSPPPRISVLDYLLEAGVRGRRS